MSLTSCRAAPPRNRMIDCHYTERLEECKRKNREVTGPTQSRGEREARRRGGIPDSRAKSAKSAKAWKPLWKRILPVPSARWGELSERAAFLPAAFPNRLARSARPTRASRRGWAFPRASSRVGRRVPSPPAKGTRTGARMAGADAGPPPPPRIRTRHPPPATSHPLAGRDCPPYPRCAQGMGFSKSEHTRVGRRVPSPPANGMRTGGEKGGRGCGHAPLPRIRTRHPPPPTSQPLAGRDCPPYHALRAWNALFHARARG